MRWWVPGILALGLACVAGAGPADPTATVSGTAALLEELKARDPELLVLRESKSADAPIESLVGNLFDAAPGGAEATAKGFVEKYGLLLGFEGGWPGDLARQGGTKGAGGESLVLVPEKQGVPFPGGAITLQCAPDGRLVSVSGRHEKLAGVAMGSLKANDAVEAALREIAKDLPGTWLSGDGKVREYIRELGSGRLEHVYEAHLAVGDPQRHFRVVLAHDGSRVSVSEHGEGFEFADGDGTVFPTESYPNPAPSPGKLPELYDEGPGTRHLVMGRHFLSYSSHALHAISLDRHFPFDPKRTVQGATETQEDDPRFMEVNVYHHLAIAHDRAMAWGATEVDVWPLRPMLIDVWNPAEGNAAYKWDNHSINFAIPDKHHPISRAWDCSIIYHEYGHFVHRRINPTWDVAKGWPDEMEARAISEGWGDFFSMSITGHATEGELVKGQKDARTPDDLTNKCGLGNIFDEWAKKDYSPPDPRTDIHEAGRVFSSTCLQLKPILGDRTVPVVMEALRLAHPNTFARFGTGLLAVLFAQGDLDRFHRARQVLYDREFFDKCR